MTELLSPTAPAVEMLALDEIHAFEGNSKAHPPEQVAALARSIREFGFTAPVLIDELGILLAGHGRVMAAREVGLLSVPAIRVTHLTPDQKRAYVIADNRLTELGGWDEKALAEQIQMLMDAGVDVSVTGFDDKDSKRLLAALTASAGNTDPDAAPPLQKKAISRRGDVWTLGRHRVMCGDSTVQADVDELMAGGEADLVCTDPPYGVSANGGRSNTVKKKGIRSIENDDLRGASLEAFLVKSLSCIPIRDGGSFYVFYDQKTQYEFVSALRSISWRQRSTLVWNKNVFGLSGFKGYRPKFEMVAFGHTGADYEWNGDNSQADVIDCPRPADRPGGHPTPKPVELISQFIGNSCRHGGVVADTFGGSGTTLIAAEKNGRDARLMELDPRYCDVIVRRWQEFTGLKAVHAGDGVEFDEIATLR